MIAPPIEATVLSLIEQGIVCSLAGVNAAGTPVIVQVVEFEAAVNVGNSMQITFPARDQFTVAVGAVVHPVNVPVKLPVS